MISIITTFHNSQSHILDCLKSVQMISDSTDFEHILVNDGSTDNSELIIKNNKSHKQRLIGGDKLGRGVALNLGIQNAKGEFICILDSDDLIHPEWIESFFSIDNFLKSTNRKASVIFGKNAVEDGNADLLLGLSKLPNNEEFCIRKLNSRKVYFYNPIPHLGAIIYKEDLKEVDFYSYSRQSQFDWDLWLKLISKKKDFYFIDKTSGIKRVHQNQFFEHKNHFIYTLRGVRLQLMHSAKFAKLLFIPVSIVCLLRILWSVIPRNVRIQLLFKN